METSIYGKQFFSSLCVYARSLFAELLTLDLLDGPLDS